MATGKLVQTSTTSKKTLVSNPGKVKVGTVYADQTLQLTSDLKKWNDYITTNSSVILQFQDTVENIQDQLDRLSTKLNALSVKVDQISKQIVKYIKLDRNYMWLYPVKYRLTANGAISLTTTAYAHGTIDSYTSENEVFVYSNKTVSGLSIDGVNVTSVNDSSYVQNASYFYKFNGSDQGLTHDITGVNVKNDAGIILYFSYDNNYQNVIADPSKYSSLTIDINPQQTERVTNVSPTTLMDADTGVVATTLANQVKSVNVNTQINAVKATK